MLVVYFNHLETDFYAFPYNDIGFDDYFDQDGKNLRKFFLKTPVKNSRITQVLQTVFIQFKNDGNRTKEQIMLRRGTPIWATADGVIDAATYTKFNGNYVKVRHNGTYSTQYLHMSKTAKGIRPGVHVKQGQP